MSTAELQSLQRQDEAYCDMGRPGPDPTLRVYMEVATLDVLQYFVDPVAGNDTRDGRTASTAFQTLTRALCEIAPVRLARSDEPPPTPINTYEINLLPGAYTADNERRAMIPTALAGREAYFDDSSASMFFNHRAGSPDRPIIVQGYPAGGVPPRGTMRPSLEFRLNFGSVQYVYLKNLNIQITSAVPFGGNIDAAQFHTLRPEMPYPHPLRTNHLLIRNCEIFGGGTMGSPRSHEVLKVNQCQHVYVEDCQIHGAFDAGGANPVDFVAVQYGHIVDCDIYDSPNNWCIYVKGGSAYIRVEGNRIHAALSGFAAGEGTTTEFLSSPWWHYEAYAIKFVNNLIYNITQTGVGVQGGYDIEIAHNTLYNAGTSAQIFSLTFGQRDCADAECSSRITQEAWDTTSRSHVDIIPNRSIYVYNNVILIDRASTGFSVFDIAADLPIPAGAPSSLRSNLRPTETTAMLRADEDLQVRGNFMGIRGVSDTFGPDWPSMWSGFVNTHSARDMDFITAFQRDNRNDGALPQINTVETDSSNFLRATGSTSNIFDVIMTGGPAALPAPSGSWPSDFPPLPPGTTATDRPAPWVTMHNIRLDFDRLCRDSARLIPGASMRGMPTHTSVGLRVVDVSAPEINAVFDVDSIIYVDDTVDYFAVDAFLQSRLFPRGEVGTLAEGLYAYEYRIDLTNLVRTMGMPCIASMRIDFGPIRRLNFDGSGDADVYVITRGGLGNVNLTAERSGNTVTFTFARPVCGGASPGSGDTTYFFGLVSDYPPRAVRAYLRDTLGSEYNLNVRAPAFP